SMSLDCLVVRISASRERGLQSSSMVIFGTGGAFLSGRAPSRHSGRRRLRGIDAAIVATSPRFVGAVGMSCVFGGMRSVMIPMAPRLGSSQLSDLLGEIEVL